MIYEWKKIYTPIFIDRQKSAIIDKKWWLSQISEIGNMAWNMACIRSGQEVSVLVYFGEQVWIGSIFSNMACYYGIMIEVNPKFCKCGSVFNIYYLCIHDSNCTFSSTWTHDTWRMCYLTWVSLRNNLISTLIYVKSQNLL